MTTGTEPSRPTVALAQPRLLTGDNPFGVDPATDLLRPIPAGAEKWGEHMFFHTWHSGQGVGVWIHVGRAVGDPELWWAQTFARLPGDRSVASMSWGRARDDRGPATGNLRIRCEEPHRRWTLRFDGAGEPTDATALGSGLVGAGAAVPMSFDIELTTTGPVLDFVAATDIAGWKAAHMHHEQALAAAGGLTVDGHTYDLDGSIAFRDHSEGHRDLVEFGGASWPTITFPGSGRIVQCLSLWDPKRNVQGSMVSIWENGTLEVGNDFHLTGLDDTQCNPKTMTLDIVRFDGTVTTIHGENIHNIVITMAEPNHNLNGAAVDGYGDPLILNESLTRWTWTDGEVGYGNTERDYRRSMLPSPTQPLIPHSRLHPNKL